MADLAAGLIRDGKTIDQARAAVLEKIGQRDAAAGGHLNVRGIQTVQDEVQTRFAGITEAINHRVDAKAQLTDNGRQFRSMSLMEIGREHLRAQRRQHPRHEPPGVGHRRSCTTARRQHGHQRLRQPAANSGRKRLRQGYMENTPSYARWAAAPKRAGLQDHVRGQPGRRPDLLQTSRHGEIQYGAHDRRQETYSMVTYGQIVNFTRQALINDDLRGFDRLVSAFGNSAARLENRTVYSNPHGQRRAG